MDERKDGGSVVIIINPKNDLTQWTEALQKKRFPNVQKAVLDKTVVFSLADYEELYSEINDPFLRIALDHIESQDDLAPDCENEMVFIASPEVQS